MKRISKRAKAVFDQLTKGLEHVGDHKKIENGAFMPLSIEVIENYGRDEGVKISFCHYGEQNGDLMRDPEVCFIRPADGNYYPYYYRNDYLAKEQFAAEFDPYDGSIQRYWVSMQKDIATFSSQWAQNLKDQGFIKASDQLRRFDICEDKEPFDVTFAKTPNDAMEHFRSLYGSNKIDIPGVRLLQEA